MYSSKIFWEYRDVFLVEPEEKRALVFNGVVVCLCDWLFESTRFDGNLKRTQTLSRFSYLDTHHDERCVAASALERKFGSALITELMCAGLLRSGGILALSSRFEQRKPRLANSCRPGPPNRLFRLTISLSMNTEYVQINMLCLRPCLTPQEVIFARAQQPGIQTLETVGNRVIGHLPHQSRVAQLRRHL